MRNILLKNLLVSMIGLELYKKIRNNKIIKETEFYINNNIQKAYYKSILFDKK